MSPPLKVHVLVLAGKRQEAFAFVNRRCPEFHPVDAFMMRWKLFSVFYD
jgi:hypothetical protein